MRYLPPTPGISFLDRTTIGCGVVRGGPYRYSGQRLDQKPECDTWPERWKQRIAHDRPDVVLLTIGRWEIVDRMWRGQWTHIGDLAAVHQSGAAGGHPDLADLLGDLGTAFHRGQDLRVEAVDLDARASISVSSMQSSCLTFMSRFSGSILVSFGPGLTQETSPGSGCGPRGTVE